MQRFVSIVGLLCLSSAAIASDDDGFLGIVLSQRTPKQVEVKGLASGANAQKAGVREGDLILKLEGQSVKTVKGLVKSIMAMHPGDKAHIIVRRGKSELPFEILIVSRKEFLGVQIEALKGKKAPEFTGINVLTGKKLKLSEFSGKPMVINLWATWCPACVANLPKLNELAKRHADKVKVIGLSFEEAPVIKKFAEKKALAYDLVTTDSSDMSIGYMNNTSIPKYLVVDAKGTVVDVKLRASDVEDVLRSIGVD